MKIITDEMVDKIIKQYGKVFNKSPDELKKPEYQRAARLALRENESDLRCATVMRRQWDLLTEKEEKKNV